MHLDMLSDEVWNFRRKATRVVDGTWWHLVCADDAVLDADAVIVLAERRGLMDNAGAVFRGDVSVVENKESSVLELIPG